MGSHALNSILRESSWSVTTPRGSSWGSARRRCVVGSVPIRSAERPAWCRAASCRSRRSTLGGTTSPTPSSGSTEESMPTKTAVILQTSARLELLYGEGEVKEPSRSTANRHLLALDEQHPTF